MTDLRKAAEMALEALKEYTCVVTSGTDPTKWNEVVDGGAPAREAIQALRQALAQPDDFVYNEDKSYRVSPSTGSFGIGDTPPKQEPEWIEDGFGTMWQKCGKKDCGKFVVKIGKVDCWNGDCPETNAPLKREWVGLTEYQRLKFADGMHIPLKAVEKIEAKLKEKNSV